MVVRTTTAGLMTHIGVRMFAIWRYLWWDSQRGSMSDTVINCSRKLELRHVCTLFKPKKKIVSLDSTVMVCLLSLRCWHLSNDCWADVILICIMSYAINPEKYKITFTPRTRRNKRGRTLRGYQPRDPTTGNLNLQCTNEVPHVCWAQKQTGLS